MIYIVIIKIKIISLMSQAKEVLKKGDQIKNKKKNNQRIYY